MTRYTVSYMSSNLETLNIMFLSHFRSCSRAVVSTEDGESGINKIEWRIKDEKTGKVFKTGKLNGNKTSVRMEIINGTNFRTEKVKVTTVSIY